MKNKFDPAKAGIARQDLGAIGSILPYLWPEDTWLRIRVVAAIGFLIFAKIANVIVPIFYKEVVDLLTPTSSAEVILPLGLILGYGLTRLLAHVFGELRDTIFTRVAQGAVRAAGVKAFDRLHNLSVRFHLDRKTGGISRSIERGTKGIEFLLRFMLFNIAPTFFEIVLICGILWKLYGPSFSLITFLTLFGYITWTLIVTEWRLKFRRQMNETENNANSKAIDSLLNFETVKYFGNESFEVKRFDGALKDYENAAVKSSSSLAFLNIGQGIIVAIGLTLIMVLAGKGVVSNNMTLGDFVLVNTYLIQLYLPLNFLGFVYREIKRSLIDIENMFTLLNEPCDVLEKKSALTFIVTDGNIKFEGVSFAYDDSPVVLNDVTFNVNPGKRTAIVGPSGVGKSTIGRLLLRFYDVSNGRILIDGTDIRDVTLRSVRSSIGIIPQDTILFNETIYYNIAYGCPNATNGEIEKAAKAAEISDFINGLPRGYQTIVGERGLKLSGGEKQRILIARTILKNPKILILDEATSALDTRTEQEIMGSIVELSRTRTTIIIAHRLSTVVSADEILVLDKGRICESGTHDMLLANNGLYASMWELQQETARALEINERVARMEMEFSEAKSGISK